MKWPSREDWEMKLVEYPMLYAALRVLFFDYWFRLAFLGLVFGFLLLLIFVSRIWVVSPPECLPVIRISGLNWVQAKVLLKSANKSIQQGRHQDAAYAWKAAMSRNPADLDVLRGYLAYSASTNVSVKSTDASINKCFWLLRLSKTNLNDLTLVCSLLNKVDLQDHIVDLLSSFDKELTPVLEEYLCHALFQEGHYSAFASRWDRFSDEVKKNPIIQLHHSAYLAGWGPPSSRRENMQQLRARLNDPSVSITVNQLLLKISMAQRDPISYNEALRRLEFAEADSLLDHISYWQLLQSTGRQKDAIELAQSHSAPPRSAAEASRLAEFYAELGMKDRALEILEQYVPQFESSIIGWVTYAKFLSVENRWQNLRDLALHLRHEISMRDEMAGYSFFLEGQAELGMGKKETADKAFRKVIEMDFGNPSLGVTAAYELLRMGQSHYAALLIQNLEAVCTNNANYWDVASQCAYEHKQAKRLVETSERAYQLRPTLLNLNRYAAALIIQRQNAAEAVKLTFQLASAAPTTAVMLNHCQALLLNQRTDEAGKILASIKTGNLTAEEANTYNMAQFEFYCQKRDYVLAQNYLSKIDRTKLFPSELVWLQDLEKNLSKNNSRP